MNAFAKASFYKRFYGRNWIILINLLATILPAVFLENINNQRFEFRQATEPSADFFDK